MAFGGVTVDICLCITCFAAALVPFATANSNIGDIMSHIELAMVSIPSPSSQKLPLYRMYPQVDNSRIEESMNRFRMFAIG